MKTEAYSAGFGGPRGFVPCGLQFGVMFSLHP